MRSATCMSTSYGTARQSSEVSTVAKSSTRDHCIDNNAVHGQDLLSFFRSASSKTTMRRNKKLNSFHSEDGCRHTHKYFTNTSESQHTTLTIDIYRNYDTTFSFLAAIIAQVEDRCSDHDSQFRSTPGQGKSALLMHEVVFFMMGSFLDGS